MALTSWNRSTATVVAVGDVTIALDGPTEAIARVLGRLGRVGSTVEPADPPTIRARVVQRDRHTWEATTSEGTRFTRSTATEAGERLGQVLHGLIARRSTTGLYVHAGVVCFGDRLVVLPGRSGVGKSTLVAAALARGATYWSDEYAVVDHAGLVHPYPRPVALRDGDRRIIVEAEELGGRSAATARAPSAVVVTHYERGARWRPRRIQGAIAALALVGNTVPTRHRPRAALAAAVRITRSAPVVRGPRGEASATVEAIDTWVHTLDPVDG